MMDFDVAIEYMDHSKLNESKYMCVIIYLVIKIVVKQISLT
jgi:hypothetical protein